MASFVEQQETYMEMRNQAINLLSADELDAVRGGSTRVDVWEYTCPVGHLTVIKLTIDDKVKYGVNYHR